MNNKHKIWILGREVDLTNQAAQLSIYDLIDNAAGVNDLRQIAIKLAGELLITRSVIQPFAAARVYNSTGSEKLTTTRTLSASGSDIATLKEMFNQPLEEHCNKAIQPMAGLVPGR